MIDCFQLRFEKWQDVSFCYRIHCLAQLKKTKFSKDSKKMNFSQSGTQSKNQIYASIVYVGFGFFLLFSGHAAFRSLLPAIRPSSGPWLVAVNFTAYALGSLLHPRWLANYRQVCFALAALAHVQWIALLQLPIDDNDTPLGHFFIFLATLSSIVNGFGAGLLWATQGGWMAQQVQSDAKNNGYNTSRYTSCFLFFYGISGIVGNIVAACTLAYNIPVFEIIWYLFGISLAGFVWLALTPGRFLYLNYCPSEVEVVADEFISAESSESRDRSNSSDNEPTVVFDPAIISFVLPHSRWSLIKTLFTKTIFPWMLAPIFALSAMSAFAWVSLAASLPITSVPIAFCCYAVGSALGPIFASQLDRITNLVHALAQCFAIPSLLCFIYAGIYRLDLAASEYFSGAMIFLFGIVIGATNNTVYSIVSNRITLQVAKRTMLAPEQQPHLSGEAYCMHGFFYCIFFAAFSALSLALTVDKMAILIGIIMFLNTVLCVFMVKIIYARNGSLS